nr:MAG TPA: hypothetical protein [Caudoviricetes sp.]DAO37604.1 MAG TPA: hypothetical protein [Herelleviridae sp.]
MTCRRPEVSRGRGIRLSAEILFQTCNSKDNG